jgi:uncharacterized protein YegJ (DUF2314 family)
MKRIVFTPGLFVFLVLCTAALFPGCRRPPTDTNSVHRDGQPDVTYVRSEDPEMNAAIALAQKTTDTFLQALTARQPNQKGFSVKRPYPTTAGGNAREHIWISNVTFDGKLLHGTVGDEPVNIPNLKFDEPVAFPPGELTDWMYLEDGKIVGAYTTRILRKRLSPEEGAEFDRHLQFK